MNQILVSQKLYVTPDMKKKKKAFKFEFFLSVFLLCVLSSYAIYAEYDRNKSEEVSKEILQEISFQDTTKLVDEEVIVVRLNAIPEEKNVTTTQVVQIEQKIEVPDEQKLTASDGTIYYTIGVINIPSINVNYPILSTYTDELLKIAPCRFHGPNPNEVGNLCIAGHNYKNSKFFSKVPNLQLGDKIEITDLSGRMLTYTVYDKFIVNPDELECTSQLTNGNKEITLITCTNDNKQRHIIKARVM
ncbi:MAG: sortase [Clostridia bacterium]|jgi:sortase family protein|nr:lPXTG-site transpeptidase (Sortase) family protein [Clostridium sp. CAG:452]HJJ03387.1 sortase [Clostridiaceae bacterium]